MTLDDDEAARLATYLAPASPRSSLIRELRALVRR
jgi:hypothetical protein